MTSYAILDRPLVRRPAALVAVAALLASLLLMIVRAERAEALPDWLDYLNAYRDTAGVQHVTENASFSNGDMNHARYMVKNAASSPDAHSETPGNPWYTPEGAMAAMQSNVRQGWMSGGPIPGDRADIDGWMTAPFHALAMINPGLNTVGYGRFDENNQHAAALNVLGGRSSAPATTTYPKPWPANGATVPLSSYGGHESPDPLASCPGWTAPTGLPLLIQTNNGSVPPAGVSGTIADAAAPTVSIPVCLVHQGSVGLNSTGVWGLSQSNTVIMIPRTPLASGHTYNASLTASGVTTHWSFSIGAAGSTPTAGGSTSMSGGLLQVPASALRPWQHDIYCAQNILRCPPYVGRFGNLDIAGASGTSGMSDMPGGMDAMTPAPDSSGASGSALPPTSSVAFAPVEATANDVAANTPFNTPSVATSPLPQWAPGVATSPLPQWTSPPAIAGASQGLAF